MVRLWATDHELNPLIMVHLPEARFTSLLLTVMEYPIPMIGGIKFRCEDLEIGKLQDFFLKCLLFLIFFFEAYDNLTL